MRKYFVDENLSRNIFSLNGDWKFQSSNEEIIPTDFTNNIQIPSLVDCALKTNNWKNFKYHYYKLDFKVENRPSNISTFLKIYHAMYGTKVWLNDKAIGENISCYTSQNYDLTKEIGENNSLVIRVGNRDDLPKESAVGKDQERAIFIPGVWGDVELIMCGEVKINHVQIIPKCEESNFLAKIEIINLKDDNKSVKLVGVVREKKSKKIINNITEKEINLISNEIKIITIENIFEIFNYWNIDNPFLYEIELKIKIGNNFSDSLITTFGMRDFKIKNGGFYFNGERIYLKGGNIALHRFFSDEDRKLLPWNLDWVKKLLIEIPKEHNFNFFRNHIGQLYHKWYDIADENGMLLQNEWQFWGVTGSEDQIRKEFTEWIRDNCNHPSIIIWDPINESHDDFVQNEIVSEMKKIDPTRPWESVDFIEEHPYIYSLCMVRNDRKMGFTRALEDIEKDNRPKMVNEFLWWWLDKNYKPTILMDGVVERWLGKNFTKDDLIERQNYLGRELIELFRRMQIDAIQPFVYLSNNSGPTANWFLDDIKDLKLKPIMKTIKEAFSPLGISLDILDRHFNINDKIKIDTFIFNDNIKNESCKIKYGIEDVFNNKINFNEFSIDLQRSTSQKCKLEYYLPNLKGDYYFFAEIYQNDIQIDKSKKIAKVYDFNSEKLDLNILCFDNSNEIKKYCEEKQCVVWKEIKNPNLVIVNQNAFKSYEYLNSKTKISELVKSGVNLLLIEPEKNVIENENIEILNGINLKITKRNDIDKGGYDSYFHPENENDEIWNGLNKFDFRIFNGKYGGEIVSEHLIDANNKINVLARCGLNLQIPAFFEIEHGMGKIIICRLQIENRLDYNGKYSDPVIQKLFLNILKYYAKNN